MAAADAYVHVGCKMPNGVILNLMSYEIVSREHGVVQRNGDDKPTVTLKGNAFREGRPDLSIDGYVFTKVPKDFWDEWVKTHSDSPLLRDGFIKAALTMDAATKTAREYENAPGQFERITPGGDAKDRHRSQADLAARGVGAKVETFDAST